MSSPVDDLVRVSVRAGSRRVDLAVPMASPVAHLVPELGVLAGVEGEVLADHGLDLIAPGGRVLSGEAGLAEQGIREGAVLTLTAREVQPPRVHDDPVEAIAEVVARTVSPWSGVTGRRTTLGVACLALVATGALLVALGPGRLGSGLATVVALALLTLGMASARSTDDHRAGRVASWLAWPHAALAGLLAVTDTSGAGGWPPMDRLLGPPLAVGGAALVVTASAGMVGLPRGRALMAPGVVLGLVMVLLGAAGPVVPVEPGVAVTVVLTALVLAGTLLPWLAVASTGSGGRGTLPLTGTAAGSGIDPDSRPVDMEQVEADVKVVHEVLVAGSVTLGVVLVLLVPFVSARGWTGTALALLCCAAVGLRTSRARAGVEVLIGLVSSVAGLAVVATTVVLTRPDSRAVMAVVLAVAGLVLLVAAGATGPETRRPGEVSVARRERLIDLLESVVLLSLLPVTVVAVGLLDRALG